MRSVFCPERRHICAAAVDDVNITHLARELVNQLAHFVKCTGVTLRPLTYSTLQDSRRSWPLWTAHIGHFLWAAVDAKRGDHPLTSRSSRSSQHPSRPSPTCRSLQQRRGFCRSKKVLVQTMCFVFASPKLSAGWWWVNRSWPCDFYHHTE